MTPLFEALLGLLCKLVQMSEWLSWGRSGTGACLSSRCIFVRLASIGVLLFSLWSQIAFCATDKCTACGYNYELYPVSRFIVVFNLLNL